MRLEDIHVSHGATSSLYQYREQNACQFYHRPGAMRGGDTPRTVMIKRVLQDLRNHIATERARILSERTEELVDQLHAKIESGPEGAVKLTV